MAETAVEEASQTPPEENKSKRKASTKAHPKAKPGPKPPEAKKDTIPKVIPFFSRVQRIAKEDWGARAYIKVYRLEPLIDKLRGSEHKMVAKYEEPIDENRIMLDHGSGRYRLYLNFKVPGANEGKELDSVEFDILNMDYPPKVPFGEWIDDSRNKKWNWAKPKDPNAAQQQAQQATGNIVETFKVFNDIQDSVAARLAPTMPTTDPIERFLQGMQMAQKMQPQPQPATENKQLDAVMQLMTSTLAASQAEAKELRTLVFDILRKPQEQPKQNGFATLKEVLGELKGFIPEIKTLIPDQAAVHRSKMGAWQEFFSEALPHVTPIVQPFAQMFSQLILVNAQVKAEEQRLKLQEQMRKMGATPQPAGAPAQIDQPAPQTQDPNAILMEFVNTIVNPAMLNYLKQDYSGDALAESLYDLHPKYKGIDWLGMMKAAGPGAVVQLYRTSPLWPQLELMEARFVEFVTEFCAWSPDAEEETPATDSTNESPAAVGASVDLDAMGS